MATSSELHTWEGGAHADLDGGPMDVGLAITPEAMGLTIDAPVLGQLRAAFAVHRDGSTRLTALSRRTAEGIDRPIIGLTNDARLARVQYELDQSNEKLRDVEGQLSTTQRELAETRTSLQRAEASAASLHRVQGRLAETQIELRGERTQGAAKLSAAASALADLTDRFEQSERVGRTAAAQVEHLGQQLSITQAELDVQT